MKLLFSILFTTASYSLCAQITDADIEKQIRESIRKRVEEDNARKMGPSYPLLKIEPLPELQKRLVPQDPGVYALPQDGMPCLVPDTNTLATMPNAAPGIYPYRKDMPTRPHKKSIPNAK